jgi:hypothetical protein
MNSFSRPILRSLPSGITTGIAIVLANFFLTSLAAPNCHAAIQFQEVTDSAGVANTTRSYGSAWADYDGDRWPDLWTGNHNYRPRLYRNNGDGTFSNVTARVDYIRSDYHGSAWSDFDNDGDQDLIVLVGADLGTSQHPNHLFVNRNGLLTEKAVEFGVDYPSGRGRGPLWFDWNGDGDLDVLLVNRRREDLAAPTALFTQHDGRFFRHDMEDLFPIYDDYLFFAQLSLSNRAVADMPVVVIHHWSKYPGRIYGFGPEGFQDVDADFNFPGIDGIVTDVAIADFDGDLINDFFIARKNNDLSDKLFVQTPTGVVDVTAAAGIDTPSRESQSVAAADFDNDMDVDIYVVRANDRENYPNLIYENLGDGTFRVVPDAGGAKGTTIGIGSDVTTADYDMDGFVDLFVTNGRLDSEGPNQLYRNRGNANRWLEIDLEGRVSNRDGIGTQLVATAGGVSQLREQGGGIHAKAQNHARIHFGLGQNTCVQRLSLHWPSGVDQVLVSIPTNRSIHVVEPTPADAAQCILDPRFEETVLINGGKFYTDRDDLLTAVPPYYTGMRLITTPNDDFQQIAPRGYLTFQMPFDGWVYVAYDGGAVQQPTWMDDFVDTGDLLETSAEALPTLRVFGKRFNEGDCVNLGANQASVCSGGGANYIVMYSENQYFDGVAREDDSDGEENGDGEGGGDDAPASDVVGSDGGGDVQTADTVSPPTDTSAGGGGCFITGMSARSRGER